MKRIVFIVTIILAICHTLVYAGNNIGVGVHTGYHYDVGNIASSSTIQSEPQQNVLVGVTLKLDVYFLFMQIGGTKSFLLWRGTVRDDTQELSSVNIQYTALPVHIGFNFPIHDKGRFFLGVGGAYMWVTGDIVTKSDTYNLGQGIYGHGWIAGIQLRISDYIMVVFEWEYFSGKTRPVADTSASHDWKDFSADLTGHRLYFGLLYYIM